MRVPYLALAALAVVPFQIGCDLEELAQASDRYREDFQYSYDLKPGSRFNLEGYNGSIELLGWEKDSVQVTGTKYASREEMLKEIKIETKQDAGYLSIRTVRPSGHHSSGVKFVIRVPRQVELDRVVSSNGSIRIEDVQGRAHLETSNGAIRLRKFEGQLDARTSNGSIEGDSVGGEATARTSNGAIRLERVAGALEATTSNGGIHIRMLKPKPGQPVRVQSSNGAIELEIESLENSDVRASTSNSSITLRLPSSLKARLRASTNNASITSDFDVATHGTIGKNHLEGDINGGGPLIDLSSSNGSIRILKL